MSKKFSLAAKLKSLKVGQSFIVKTKREQIQVCNLAKSMRDLGYISFDIVTKTTEDGIKVAAI